ncbi:MAG: hypothetical protein ACTS8H_04015 [Arsenophonus sp. NC-PE1-MAG3]
MIGKVVDVEIIYLYTNYLRDIVIKMQDSMALRSQESLELVISLIRK